MRIFIFPPGAEQSGAEGALFTLTSYTTQINAIDQIQVLPGATQINMTAIK